MDHKSKCVMPHRHVTVTEVIDVEDWKIKKINVGFIKEWVLHKTGFYI